MFSTNCHTDKFCNRCDSKVTNRKLLNYVVDFNKGPARFKEGLNPATVKTKRWGRRVVGVRFVFVHMDMATVCIRRRSTQKTERDIKANAFLWVACWHSHVGLDRLFPDVGRNLAILLGLLYFSLSLIRETRDKALQSENIVISRRRSTLT